MMSAAHTKIPANVWADAVCKNMGARSRSDVPFDAAAVEWFNDGNVVVSGVERLLIVEFWQFTTQ